MRTTISIVLVAAAAITACGGTLPPPDEHLAAAEAASRSAKEVGAQQDPQASLYLKLADDQIAEAKTKISKGDNGSADRELVRAKADAELSIQLAKKVAAERAAAEAQAKVQAVKSGQSANAK